MKKRMFGFFMSMIMSISLLSVLPAMSAAAATSGGFTYKVLSNGTVEISKYTGTSTKVTIPGKIAGKKVTSIGKYAFYDCSDITNIIIPDTVTAIKYGAFSGCSKLSNIKLPESIKSLEDKCFEYCSGFTSLSIPDSITDIGANAFYQCTKIAKISLGNGVKNIGWGAFGLCTSLTEISIPKSVTNLYKYAFGDCMNLKKVTLPNSLSKINENVFNGCVKLESITIPTSIKSIGDSAFYACSKLKNVYYYGSKAQWDKISIGSNNNYLKNASIYYNFALYPSNVSGFKAAATSLYAVKLTWNKVSGANGYVVFRYNTNTKKYQRIAKIQTNAFTNKKLSPGTTYKFAVRAYKTVNGKEYLSPSYPQLITSTIPSEVKFKLTSGQNKVNVTWNKVSGAYAYKVYYKTSGNGKWTELTTTKGTSYTKTGLIKGRTYYFTVKAYRIVNGKTYNGRYSAKSIKVK